MRALPALNLLLLGFLWGTGYPLAKWVEAQHISPTTYTWLITSISAIFLLVVVRTTWQELKTVLCTHARYFLVTALLGVVIPNTVLNFVAKHLPLGMFSVVINTSPIFTYLIAIGLMLEQFVWRRFLGVVCGVLGLAVMLLPHAKIPMPEDFKWLLFAFIPPLSYACCAIYINLQSPKKLISPRISACGMLLYAAMMLLPLLWSTRSEVFLLMQNVAIDFWVIFAGLTAGLGYWLYFSFLGVNNPVFYSLVDGVVVVVASVWGFLIFEEALSSQFWISALLVFLGILIVNFEPHRRVQTRQKYA